MAEKSSNKQNPFDVKSIHELVRLMTKHSLSELDLQDGDKKIRMKRDSGVIPVQVPVAGMPLPAAIPSVTAPAAPAASAPEQKASTPAPSNLIEIKSPTPGTFYAQEKPTTPPFVTKGAKVTPTTVVCLIEAMKLFNEIPAECTGTIVEILVENKQPVEYGQVLFRVDPNG